MDRLTLRERNKQRVTRQIIMAASELFKTRGYHSTTMDDIAEKAEISRATLFNYFPFKETLLLPWGKEIVEQQIISQLTKYMITQPTTWQVFHFMFIKMSKILEEYPDIIQALVQEAVKDFRPDRTDLEGMDHQDVYLRIIRYGQQRGEIRTDLPLENLVSYLYALQMSLFFRIRDPILARNPSLEIDNLLAFLKEGLKEEK